MPGKVKVKILAGRNLPVMDRSSDTTDAYVEIKLGNTTYKTDVCRKSLNPQWNSEWYRYEVDDSELQDEPLQIRLMDHDTYSANDAIGKVYLDLNPLLLPASPAPVKSTWNSENATTAGTSFTGGTVMSGWIPVFDTMHGIRGEVNIIVKVELFSDFNKFRQSSCGVQFFCSPAIPQGYHAQVIHGFVEELVVNDDPEYQWIDKIRTPRASNEARQTLFFKLSGEVQRKIGLKALDLGGNAVIGYQQCFDLEGESGIVVRGIGTAVTLTKLQEVSAQPPLPLDQEDMRAEAQPGSRFARGLRALRLFPQNKLSKRLIALKSRLQTDMSVDEEVESNDSSMCDYDESDLKKQKVKFERRHSRSSSDSIADAIIKSLMENNSSLDRVVEVRESPGSSPTSPSRKESYAGVEFSKHGTWVHITVSESFLRLPSNDDGPELRYVDDSSSSEEDASEDYSFDAAFKTPSERPTPSPLTITTSFSFSANESASVDTENNVVLPLAQHFKQPEFNDPSATSTPNIDDEKTSDVGFFDNSNVKNNDVTNVPSSLEKTVPDIKPNSIKESHIFPSITPIGEISCTQESVEHCTPVEGESKTGSQLVMKLSQRPASAMGSKISPSPAKLSTLPGIHRRSSDSDLSITPKGSSRKRF
ncbi:hypothetical protein L9F63_026179, partial [Diploptera punctata]